MDALHRLRACRAFLLDMDGTIYLDEELLPGAAELFRLLGARGVPYVFVTNNSSRRAEDYRSRLSRLGIATHPEQVLTSGDATIGHLLHATPYRSAYVIGTPGLEADFRAAGFELDAADPDCVVVGFDTTLTYAKLARCCELLFAGKPYFATHPDKTCITRGGLVPDIAAIIAGCEAVTGRTPQIIGKPSGVMAAAGLRRLGTRAEETAVVGDQLDTDLAMARGAGLLGVLVLSGETTAAKVETLPADERPDLVARGVAELVDWLR